MKASRKLPKRIAYLDSVRGIAAVMVVFYHYFGWKGAGTPIFQTAVFFINGADAVSFFFVLSGMVLSYKYLHFKERIRLKRYTIGRFFRLYPAFLFVVLVNYVYLRYGYGIRMLTDIFWYNNTEIWHELFLLRGHHSFLAVGWTLGVEMALSLLLPFFIVAAKQHGKYIFYAIAVILLVGKGYISQFALHFCLGILLAKYFPKIQAYDFTKNRLYAYRYLLYLGLFFLFSLRHLDEALLLNLGLKAQQNFWHISFYSLSGIASFFILLKIINDEKWQKRLQHPVLIYIGKISYSVYLIHYLFVFEVMERWTFYQSFFGNYYLTYWVMFLVVCLLTWAVAHWMYYAIELPWVRFGKRRKKTKT